MATSNKYLFHQTLLYHHTCKLFTVVAWINGSTIFFRVISDQQTHPKYCSFLNTQGTIQRINIFSSSVAQHFKQHFLLNVVTLIPEFLGIYREEVDITFNLYAISHRKGTVDSVGGSIKRSVIFTVVSRKVLIHNSMDITNTAKEVCKKI